MHHTAICNPANSLSLAHASCASLSVVSFRNKWIGGSPCEPKLWLGWNSKFEDHVVDKKLYSSKASAKGMKKNSTKTSSWRKVRFGVFFGSIRRINPCYPLHVTEGARLCFLCRGFHKLKQRYNEIDWKTFERYNWQSNLLQRSSCEESSFHPSVHSGHWDLDFSSLEGVSVWSVCNSLV